MRDKDMPFPPPVPQPKPIETRRIYREIVIKVAKEARQELFEEEKEKTYHAICNAALMAVLMLLIGFQKIATPQT